MRLRKLELKDAPFMFEWMKDSNVNCWFRFNPDCITMNTVSEFITENNNVNSINYHYAIVDDNDGYLGTVSIKNIDHEALNGEYAIVLRHAAQGKGAGKFATKEIERIAFQELGLHRLYLNVFSDNKGAWSFYEHMGFIFEGESVDCLKIGNEYRSLRWYRKLDNEF